jgi:hypothetical protein
MNISISQEEVDNFVFSIEPLTTACPIALAIRRHYPQYETVIVGYGRIVLSLTKVYKDAKAYTPPSFVTKWMYDFDIRDVKVPLSFELDVN